ncbi:hypothetical protein N7G274_006944 [Stereocaulon virgatum]|uniref:Uncharacterized protein n=1 Tax=Stereocaulon virgatum TaxID=373712 RepID=A0ABR4A6E0_9LECA
MISPHSRFCISSSHLPSSSPCSSSLKIIHTNQHPILTSTIPSITQLKKDEMVIKGVGQWVDAVGGIYGDPVDLAERPKLVSCFNPTTPFARTQSTLQSPKTSLPARCLTRDIQPLPQVRAAMSDFNQRAEGKVPPINAKIIGVSTQLPISYPTNPLTSNIFPPRPSPLVKQTLSASALQHNKRSKRRKIRTLIPLTKI